MKVIETDRLILRTWVDEDVAPLCALNQDERVMAYFPSLVDANESQRFVDKVKQHFMDHGYSLNACVRKDTDEFIGFVGLLEVGFEAHFTPATEIGWRLAYKHWGQGFATEAAQAVVNHAFGAIGLKELVSFTAAMNQRSRRVMEKLGMQHNPADDFDHPKLDRESPLLRHVLYRLSRKNLDIALS